MAKYNGCFGSNIESMRDLQIKAIEWLYQGKDCICSLPTGYGKSLIYEILPFIYADPLCILVIVPLNTIIQQQVDKLKPFGMQISSECRKEVTPLKSGEYIYLFCHPEHILQRKDLNSVFCSNLYLSRKFFIVIDEAHCVLDLGEHFRPDFKKLFSLALSATSRANYQKPLQMKGYEVFFFLKWKCLSY